MPGADIKDASIETVLAVNRYEDYALQLKAYRQRHGLRQADLAAPLMAEE